MPEFTLRRNHGWNVELEKDSSTASTAYFEQKVRATLNSRRGAMIPSFDIYVCVCVCAASRAFVANQIDAKENTESLAITRTKVLVWLRAILAARFKCPGSVDLIMRTEQRLDIIVALTLITKSLIPVVARE